MRQLGTRGQVKVKVKINYIIVLIVPLLLKVEPKPLDFGAGNIQVCVAKSM